MLKATQIVKIIDVCLIILYVFLLAFGGQTKIWFSLALILLSVPSFFRAYFFRLDSKVYLGSILLFCGLFGIFTQRYQLDLKVFYPAYIFILGLSSFLVFVFFRQKFHLKVFVICILEVLLLVVYKLLYISLVEFLLLELAFLIFLSTNISTRIFINTRSN